MSKINRMVRNVAGVASALALALFLSGCAKHESVAAVDGRADATADVQADSHAQMVAQADLPEVIVTASRDTPTSHQ